MSLPRLVDADIAEDGIGDLQAIGFSNRNWWVVMVAE